MWDTVGALGAPGLLGQVVNRDKYKYHDVELNDTIHFNTWTFNVGVLDSQDTLYGQGLAKANNVAGFVSSPWLSKATAGLAGLALIYGACVLFGRFVSRNRST